LKSKNLCLICIILLGLLSACQSGTPPPATALSTPTTAPATPTAVPTQAPTPTSSVRGKVTLWLSWNPLELATLQQVIAVFHERYPEVTFAIAYYPEEELRAALESAPLEGNAPSIVFAPSSWGPRLRQSGVIMDLINIADVELQATINPLAWSQVAYDSVILGLPIEILGVFLFRNRSLVQEPAATLDELIAVTQQLKDDRDIGAGLDYGFTFSVSQLAACDGHLLDENGELAVNNEIGICWLRLLRSLRDAGQVTFNTDDDLQLFEAGRSAWLIEKSSEVPHMEKVVGANNIAIDPWPVYNETGKRLAGFVWTENAYLVEGSTPVDFEASWAFVRYLLTPEAQLLLSDPNSAYHLPVLNGLELTDVLQAQMSASLPSGVSLPLVVNLDLYFEPLEGAVRWMAIHGATPELALDTAARKIEQALDINREQE
jgi:ABC-type glycerol-3-phosphate transport system substrate-binding protein